MTDVPDPPKVEPLSAADLLSGLADQDGHIKLNPETIEGDLAKLVLGLMEFLRQLMELQAIRRMESGSLTEQEEERVGETLMRAAHAIRDVAEKFGLSEEDLSIDLGPLGRTI